VVAVEGGVEREVIVAVTVESLSVVAFVVIVNEPIPLALVLTVAVLNVRVGSSVVRVTVYVQAGITVRVTVPLATGGLAVLVLIGSVNTPGVYEPEGGGIVIVPVADHVVVNQAPG